ncbi:MAG: hypothetical protein AB2693_25425 [Candidatus Thiodiazotropha sp.]
MVFQRRLAQELSDEGSGEKAIDDSDADNDSLDSNISDIPQKQSETSQKACMEEKERKDNKKETVLTLNTHNAGPRPKR